MNKKTLKEIEQIVGRQRVITTRRFMENYLRDETPEPVRPSPATDLVLVKPSKTEEISHLLKVANREEVPVFPVGGRTGLVGASVPTRPGIILSLEMMNRIDIDPDDMMAIVEAGATLGDLFKVSEKAGLFFPPHPGDEGAQIGGLVATNAGGVRAVKYGVVRNYVKGIEVVLPTGEVLNFGGKLIKDNMGYSLIDLIIGSEGTLCVITKVVIKLYPKPKVTSTLVIPFNNRHDATYSVQAILRSGIIPLAIEYVEQEQINQSAEHLNEKWPVQIGKAQLIIILAAESKEEIFSTCEIIAEICQKRNSGDIIFAGTDAEQEKILRIRSNIYTTLKPMIVDILDVTVPPSKLGDLMDVVDTIAEKKGIRLPIYGHAGDGNLHIHIMREKEELQDYVPSVKSGIYQASALLGGVITGEHGIGEIRTKELAQRIRGKQLDLMNEIKKIFDPNNILNPGKVLPLS